MVSQAILLAYDIFDQHQFEVIHSTCHSSSLNVLQPVFSMDDDSIFFYTGWATNKPWGAKFGTMYISNYREDVLEMFQMGESDNSKKRGPIRILAELRRKYPGRLDLPSEGEIRTEILALMKRKMRWGTSGPQTRRYKEERRYKGKGMGEPYVTMITDRVKNFPRMTPKEHWLKLLEEFPQTEENKSDYPTQKQVKARIDTIRKREKGGYRELYKKQKHQLCLSQSKAKGKELGLGVATLALILTQ